MLLNFRDNVQFHVTGIGGYTIKKPDWFSKKDVTELSEQCPRAQYSPAGYLHARKRFLHFCQHFCKSCSENQSPSVTQNET
jgi:hypothetical protein